ncbi:MAG: AMP-binding protein, partial [Akkermansiaceae bacterium]|nr:AMP-binding protein [Armatimonadota bacterium]
MSEMIGTAQTLPELFQNTVAKFGAKAALRHRIGKEWHEISFRELAQRVEAMASGLASFGVKKGDRVALLSENRPEWTVVDLAILHLGGVVVPIYPTLPSPQVAYIVRNSEANIIVVENAKQLAKVVDARAELPELRSVVVIDTEKIPEGSDAVSLESVIARGTETPLGA